MLFFLSVFHSESSKHGKRTEEILFLVEMHSIFRVRKWMDCKKVNLIVVQPPSSNNGQKESSHFLTSWLTARGKTSHSAANGA